MTVLSIPTVGSMGMISDVDSVESSIQAWTIAINARFEDERVSRGPIFSEFYQMGDGTGTVTSVRQMYGYRDSVGVDHLLVADNNFDLWEISTTSPQVKVSPTTGFAPLDAYAGITTAALSDVVYFNRPDQTPVYRAATSSGPFSVLSGYDSGFRDSENPSELPNLPANIRANAIATYNDMVVLIGLQQGGLAAPKSVRWSDYAITDGQPPLNWMIDSTESSGGQNTLAEMYGNLVSGTRLGSDLILHGEKETWKMTANGNITTIFDFTRLFDAGVMSVNCAIEHENLLYCFGDNDLYVTDGHTKTSIAYGKVRNFIYQNIVNTQRDKCFAFHSPDQNEILFCFPSNDAYCAFPYSQYNLGCNRAVAYNYQAQTFYCYDLPYITSGTQINTYTGLTWDQATMTWDAITGSWSGLEDGATGVVALGSNTSVAPSAANAAIRTYAIYEEAVATGIVDTFANTPCLLYKLNMPCDALTAFPQFAAKLRDYKLISALYLKGQLYLESEPVTFTIGVADQPSDNPSWGNPMDWTATYSKLDFNDAGRYISIKAEYDDYRSFRVDGIDIDISIAGGFGY